MMEQVKRKAVFFLPVIVCFFGVFFASVFWMNNYRQASYENVSAFCETLLQENPDAEEQVLSALKKYDDYTSQQIDGNAFLEQYGYRIENFYKGMGWEFPAASIGLFLLIAGCFTASAGYARRRSQKRIEELTNYLEQINVGTEGLILQKKEDEFSRLQDEMYKTVTELFRTKEAAVKAKKNFAKNLANIAHQLKTPITAAFLSLQLMEKTAPNGYGEQIRKPLERLNSLEEALLTLSKIDTGTLQLEHSSVDLYTALNLAAENLSELLADKKVEVYIPYQGCAEITGDLEWTMQAFMNLIKNCMEHSPRGGTIFCDYFCNPLYRQVRIWDEGEGFDPEDIPHLFERFYRGKRTVGNGMGIGLSLARSVIELQNGNITARNLPEGGACFEIRFYSH